MPNLGIKKGTFLARFRYQGREYKKSLKTTDRKSAEAAMAQVELTLHRLAVGLLRLPDGVDPGAFVVSGGTLDPAAARRPPASPRAAAAVTEYLGNVGHYAATNRVTIGVHLRNLLSTLRRAGDVPHERVGPADLEAFLQARLRERAGTTVAKERETVVGFFAWAVARGYLSRVPGRRAAPGQGERRPPAVPDDPLPRHVPDQPTGE